jgi:GTPase SAR1 family protein
MIQKKVCMVGTLGVGKTSLVAKFVHSMFSDKYLTTVGVKIDKKTVAVVRYEAVNAMLLNEFLKEHRRAEQQRKQFEEKFAQQQKQIEALTATVQNVSDQLALSKAPVQLVATP